MNETNSEPKAKRNLKKKPKEESDGRRPPRPEFVNWLEENSVAVAGILFVGLAISVFLHFRPLEREKATDIADIFNNVIQGLAIVIGGIWAIFRFRKGREFQESLVLNVTGKIAVIDGQTFIVVNTQAQNVGHSKIDFALGASTLEIYEYIKTSTTEVITVPDKLITQFDPLHEDDRYIEPNEIIHATRLIAIPYPPDLGFRLDFKVVSANNNYTWRTTCMVGKSNPDGNMSREERSSGG